MKEYLVKKNLMKGQSRKFENLNNLPILKLNITLIVLITMCNLTFGTLQAKIMSRKRS